MRWFKHMVSSADDEKLSKLTDAHGLEGYGFWWRIVEIVAEKVGPDGQTSAEFSLRKWGAMLVLSPSKTRRMAETCAKLGLFSVVFFENTMTVNMPNILKFRDEYTEKQVRKSGQNPDKLRPSRARVPEADTETDTEADKTISTTENKESAQPKGPPEVVSDFSDTPGIEFQELRNFYDEHCRPEAPLTGFIEYKQLRASKRWPGQSRIYDAIDAHARADPAGWKTFAPGLAKFLREHWWEKKPSSRASPQQGESPLRENMQTSAQVLAERQRRRQANDAAI